MAKVENKVVWVSVVAIVLSIASIAYSFTSLTGISNDIASLKDTVEKIGEEIGLEKLLAAKEEGKLIYYTSIMSPQTEPLIAAFKAKYPWMEVEWIRASSMKTYTRYISEVEAGVDTCDVICTAAPETFVMMKTEGNIRYYLSPEYKNYPPEFKDEGYWFAAKVTAMPIMYSTRVTVPPMSWEDLLKPEYSGYTFAMEDIRGSGSGYWHYYSLRTLLGKEFWEELGKKDVLMETSWAALFEKAIMGEYDIVANVGDFTIVEYRDVKEAPIDCVYPEEGVPVYPGPMAIVKQARHPNAAELFIDFVMSPEGQSIHAEYGMPSARADIPSPEGLPSITEINAIKFEMGDFAGKRSEMEAEFAEFFALAG